MNEKNFKLEGQLQNLQEKNVLQESVNQNLMQELWKSKEREQKLESLLQTIYANSSWQKPKAEEQHHTPSLNERDRLIPRLLDRSKWADNRNMQGEV